MCFKSFQARTTTITEQNDRLSMCIEELYTLVSANEFSGIVVDLFAGVETANESVTTV